jgi:hypothetical protein
MSSITRKLIVGAVAAGATIGLGMGLASAQTDTPPTTDSLPTTQAPSPDADRKDCPWRHGRDGGDAPGRDGTPGTTPSTDATSSAV